MRDALNGSTVEREAYRAVNREKVPDRQCGQCGNQFKPQREKAATRFCSLRCFNASQKLDIPERACGHCGTMFTPTSTNVAAKFCTRECADKAKRVYQPKPCMVCETVFIPKREDHNYCSLKCSHAGLAFREVECVCRCCNETFMAKRADVEYCSISCQRLVYRVKTGGIKRISSPLLDYLFRQQGLRITTDKMAA